MPPTNKKLFWGKKTKFPTFVIARKLNQVKVLNKFQKKNCLYENLKKCKTHSKSISVAIEMKNFSLYSFMPCIRSTDDDENFIKNSFEFHLNVEEGKSNKRRGENQLIDVEFCQ
jgi:hypothetical protein